jgi:hypothetical protein
MDAAVEFRCLKLFPHKKLFSKWKEQAPEKTKGKHSVAVFALALLTFKLLKQLLQQSRHIHRRRFGRSQP